MPLPWVRLDTAFPRNHKVVALLSHRNHRAVLVYLFGLAYAGEQGTDGFIPRETLILLRARSADAHALVNVGLWHEEPGGWQINDWAEFQPTSAEQRARSQKARDAAAVRWAKARHNGRGGGDPPGHA